MSLLRAQRLWQPHELGNAAGPDDDGARQSRCVCSGGAQGYGCVELSGRKAGSYAGELLHVFRSDALAMFDASHVCLARSAGTRYLLC